MKQKLNHNFKPVIQLARITPGNFVELYNPRDSHPAFRTFTVYQYYKFNIVRTKVVTTEAQAIAVANDFYNTLLRIKYRPSLADTLIPEEPTYESNARKPYQPPQQDSDEAKRARLEALGTFTKEQIDGILALGV